MFNFGAIIADAPADWFMQAILIRGGDLLMTEVFKSFTQPTQKMQHHDVQMRSKSCKTAKM